MFHVARAVVITSATSYGVKLVTTGLTTTFSYDAVGNVTSEGLNESGTEYWTTSKIVDGVAEITEHTTTFNRTLKNATTTYDALGRLATWAEAGSVDMPASTLAYSYDSNGNVRRSLSTYRALDAQGVAATTATTRDLWYRYDSLNRMVTDKGSLTGGAIVRGTSGVDLFYDAAGERVSLATLCEELFQRGLQRRSGGALTVAALSDILNNPFYAGVIRIKASGERFKGIHEPLVSWRLFERVQAVLKGKLVPKLVAHDFTYRRVLSCGLCGRGLTGERQKGRVYYRCHQRTCPTTGVREDVVELEVRQILSRITLTEAEALEARAYLQKRLAERAADKATELAAAQLALDNAKSRLNRLTDAFVDGALSKEVFDERRAGLLGDMATLEDRLTHFDAHTAEIATRANQTFELLENLILGYESALPSERRRILETVSSNRTLSRKKLAIRLYEPFQTLAKCDSVGFGGPYRIRTCDPLIANEMLYQLS